MKLSKKGQVMEQLGALGVGVCVLAITLTVTFLILSQSKTSMKNNMMCGDANSYYVNDTHCCVTGATTCAGVNKTGFSDAYNATNTLTNGVADIPGWVPLIIIAFVGAVLLGLVAMFKR